MDENEFRQGLRRCELDIGKLCAFVYSQTGAIISDAHIRTALRRYGKLSEPMTGLFRFVFMKIEGDIRSE